jgi:hypothetical protein
MKTIRKWLKTIALFFTALILFQSCATYKTPVTLEQAAQDEKAVKIITITDETYQYNYIVYEEGQFYGVKDNPGDDVKFPINAEDVAEVLKKEGGLPTWAIVVVSALAGIALFIVILAIAFWNY